MPGATATDVGGEQRAYNHHILGTQHVLIVFNIIVIICHMHGEPLFLVRLTPKSNSHVFLFHVRNNNNRTMIRVTIMLRKDRAIVHTLNKVF
jgi:hypothetical protein